MENSDKSTATSTPVDKGTPFSLMAACSKAKIAPLNFCIKKNLLV